MVTTQIGQDVHRAAAYLRSGDVVAIPTETVYGLAANAFDESAVLKVFQVKERPSFDPLIVHAGNREQVHQIAREIPGVALQLMDHFWPGPLTLVLKKQPVIADIVTSGLDSVGIRMPSHPLTQQLLQQLDFPLAAPSANPFGYISPTTAQHVMDQLSGKIPYILDGGPCTIGVESTIVGFDNGNAVIYRYGGITADAIRAIAGNVIESVQSVSNAPAPAPGMLVSHYAPRKPFYLGNVAALIEKYSTRKVGLITYGPPVFTVPVGALVEVLSENELLDEAARNLFSALRRLDASDTEIIIAETVPDTGIGKAINDRLRRAAAPR